MASTPEQRAKWREQNARRSERLAEYRLRKRIEEELDALKEKARSAADGVEVSPEHRAGKKYTPRQLARARRVASEAEAWTKENPQAWAFFRSRVAAECAAKRHFSIGQIAHEVRRIDFTGKDGSPTKVNNNNLAWWSRMLAEEFDGMAELSERRPSPFDVVAEERGMHGR